MENSLENSADTAASSVRRRPCRDAGIALLLALEALATGCVTGDSGRHAANTAPIHVESVRLTAAGHYIDLRYRVVDPEQAQRALGPKVRPQLINEATGTVMAVPMTAKLGALRQTQAVQKSWPHVFRHVCQQRRRAGGQPRHRGVG